MIIFGTATTNPTVSQGTFFCPRCNVERPYSLKAVRRWFSLYFIPMIPMGTYGEFVECGACAGTFAVEVLSYDPAEDEAEAFRSIRRTVVLVMMMTGRIEQTNIDRLCHAMRELGQEVLPHDIHSDMQQAQEAGAQLVPFAQSQLADLTPKGKDLVMECAIDVISVGGFLTDDDKQVLRMLGQGLMIPPGRVEEMLA